MADDRERLVQPEPEVLEGEDDVPRQPAQPQHDTEMDPVGTPARETSGGRAAFSAMRFAWVAIGIVAAIVIYAALR